MKAEPRGLYVHIPFCVKKCNYCDFCSFSDIKPFDRRIYISRLKNEIESYKRKEKIAVDTVFFGGGTPSLLEPDEFLEIIGCIKDTFILMPEFEFTLEANPKTLTEKKLRAYTLGGVNRISVGLQSIHENELKMLGRIHSFKDFQEAISMVRGSGISNISVDVMYGIPEQTKQSFLQTLSTVINMNPEHISAYGLILEENTKFWNIKDTLKIPSEDEECDMYFAASRLLDDSGYSHYEISNYSKKGFESRHNLKYWRDKEYIGVGISAYSYFEGVRFGNTRSMCEYISSANPKVNEEKIGLYESAYEYAMLALRLSDGFSLSEYQNIFGVDFLKGRENLLDEFSSAGYLKLENGRIFFTERGFYVSNALLAELL